jgi:hypothetical protein
MKQASIGAALLCAALSTTAQAPFLTGDELAAEVAKNCADGCIVLNPQEVAGLQAAIDAMVNARAAEAYRKGALSCRNAL